MAIDQRRLLSAAAVGLGALAASLACAARAQTAPAPSDAVIVTAQKREQNLQLVPVDVTAVSAVRATQAGVVDIKSLQVLMPGLTVTSSTSEASTTARIRGIGTVGDNPGLKSSVGVVIDGVYRPRNGVGFEDLGELDRIEVLKGPQGTLFGKSTSAGVINVLTAQPSFKPGYTAEATAGNYNGWGVKGSVTGPWSKTSSPGVCTSAERAARATTPSFPPPGRARTGATMTRMRGARAASCSTRPPISCACA